MFNVKFVEAVPFMEKWACVFDVSDDSGIYGDFRVRTRYMWNTKKEAKAASKALMEEFALNGKFKNEVVG